VVIVVGQGEGGEDGDEDSRVKVTAMRGVMQEYVVDRCLLVQKMPGYRSVLMCTGILFFPFVSMFLSSSACLIVTQWVLGIRALHPMVSNDVYSFF